MVAMTVLHPTRPDPILTHHTPPQSLPPTPHITTCISPLTCCPSKVLSLTGTTPTGHLAIATWSHFKYIIILLLWINASGIIEPSPGCLLCSWSLRRCTICACTFELKPSIYYLTVAPCTVINELINHYNDIWRLDFIIPEIVYSLTYINQAYIVLDIRWIIY